MHEYRRFVQDELDKRGWKQADLVRRSGLSRQLISNLLTDDRDHLGQMPDDSTIEGLANGFGVPVELVRTAAARALAGYVDDGKPLAVELSEVSIDALLGEIRRRVVGGAAVGSDEPEKFPARWRASAAKDAPVRRAEDRKQGRKLGRG